MYDRLLKVAYLRAHMYVYALLHSFYSKLIRVSIFETVVPKDETAEEQLLLPYPL